MTAQIITQEEREIIKLCGKGYKIKEICEKLNMTRYAYNKICKNIKNKFGVENTFLMVMYAIRKKIVGVEEIDT